MSQLSAPDLRLEFQKTNLRIKSASSRFRLEFEKTNIKIRTKIFEILYEYVRVYVSICVSANFQAKQTALTFSAQICLKMDIGLAIQKTVFVIRISFLDIPCVPIFSQNEQLFFVQKRI